MNEPEEIFVCWNNGNYFDFIDLTNMRVSVDSYDNLMNMRSDYNDGSLEVMPLGNTIHSTLWSAMLGGIVIGPKGGTFAEYLSVDHPELLL